MLGKQLGGFSSTYLVIVVIIGVSNVGMLLLDAGVQAHFAATHRTASNFVRGIGSSRDIACRGSRLNMSRRCDAELANESTICSFYCKRAAFKVFLWPKILSRILASDPQHTASP